MATTATVLVLFLPASLSAQETPPTFPGGTELVALDMVVRDETGQLVTDLKPEEIEVFEDGMACLLQSVRLVRAGAAATPVSSPVATNTPVATASISTLEASSPPGDSESPLRPNVVILVFDRLGMEAAGMARQAAVDFARREFPPETWFAVYEIGDRVQVRQRITSDAAVLVPAIEQATAGAGQAHARSADGNALTREALRAALIASQDTTGLDGVDPGAAGWIGQGGEKHFDQAKARLGRLADTMERQRLGRSALHALLAVAQELAGLKGRKTLLFFSEGLHVPGSLTGALEDLVSEANRSNLAIYAIDPRGLLTQGSFEESRMALLAARNVSERRQRTKDPQTSSARDPIQNPEEDQAASPTEVQMHDIAEESLRLNTQANLRDVAEATGGFLVADTNDLASGLERIGGDLRGYYELAYYPFKPFADGAFRTIEVKVARRGVEVRTRRGYFARSPGATTVLEPHELALAQALDLPTPPRDFGHRVTTQIVGGVPGRSEVQLSLQVPLRALHFGYDRANRKYRAHFSVLAVVLDGEGSVVTRLSHDWPMAGLLVDAPVVRSQSATVKRTLELAPGDYTLETAVGDRLGGGLSVQRTTFVVPGLDPTAGGR